MKYTLIPLLFIFSTSLANANQPLLSEARRELGAMTSSTYQHKTSVDESVGQFDYDCSGFLDYALARFDKPALAEIPISKPESKRPLAEDYFELFANPRTLGSRWMSVSQAIDLQPGDIIAWLLPPTSESKDTGHVMIVAEPAQINPLDHLQVLIKVIDSAASGHAADSRSKGQSGLGTGTIAILNDAKTAQPIGFYWRANESKNPGLTQVVFGRLVPRSI